MASITSTGELAPTPDRAGRDGGGAGDATIAPTDADAVLAAAEERAALIVRDAEARARRLVADAVQEGRNRLDGIAAEEREARRRLLMVQHELRHIVERISHSDDTVIDLTGAVVRFGLRPRSGARPPQPRELNGPTEDDELVDVMVRRAVDEALTHAGEPFDR